MEKNGWEQGGVIPEGWLCGGVCEQQQRNPVIVSPHCMTMGDPCSSNCQLDISDFERKSKFQRLG